MGIIDKGEAMRLAVGGNGKSIGKLTGGSLTGASVLGKLNGIGTVISGIQFVAQFYDAMKKLLDLDDKGLKRFNEGAKRTFSATQLQLEGEEKQLNLLINRYNELNTVTKPTSEQQSELKDVIRQISSLMPQAAIKWDQYGQAVKISSVNALQGISDQKRLINDFTGMNVTDWVQELHRETMEVNKYRKELAQGMKWSDAYEFLGKEELSDAERKETERNLNDLEQKREVILKLLTQLGLSRGEIMTEVRKAFNTTAAFDFKTMDPLKYENAEKKEVTDTMVDYFNRIESRDIDTKALSPTVKKQIEKLESNLKTEKEKLQKMRQEDSKTPGSEIVNQSGYVNRLEGELSALKGKSLHRQSTTPSIKQGSMVRVDVDRLLIDSQLELEAERLSIMEEGKDKRLKMSELEHREKATAIRRQQEEQMALLKAGGEEMPQEVNESFGQRFVENDRAKVERDKVIEKQYDEELRQRTAALTQFFLTEEEQKREAVKERYDEQRKWAEQQKETGGLTEGQYADFNRKVTEAEQRDQHARLLAELNDFKTQEEKITREWDAKIATAGGDAQLVGKLTSGKQKALGNLGAGALMQSDEWTQLFGSMDELTVTQIDKLIAEIQAKMQDGNFQFDPVNLKVLTEKLNEAKQRVVTLNPFKAMGDSLQEVFGRAGVDAGNVTEEIGNKWERLGESTRGCFDFINDAVNSCGVLSEILGESGQQSMAMIQGVAMAGMAMSSAIKKAETGSIVLVAISAALMIVNSLFTIFNKDKKQEKKIQRLQGEVEGLERAYNRLGRAIENTYSDNVYNLMNDQNENLLQQQELIRQQIEAEKKKKKTDKGKVKDWENEIEDINQKLEDNKRKQIEMFSGTDVQSAIDEFADALMGAYAKGEDGVKALGDTTKKVMANAVKEALKKKFLGDSIKDAVNFLGESMTDGQLSEGEQRDFQNKVADAGKNYMAAVSAAGDLLKDSIDGSGEGVTGQLQAAMTEGTASELVGLWNMTAVDTRALRDMTMEQVQIGRMMDLNVREVLNQQYLIEMNTRVTADNTGLTVTQLATGFTQLDTRLMAIEANTKGYTGRGK